MVIGSFHSCHDDSGSTKTQTTWQQCLQEERICHCAGKFLEKFFYYSQMKSLINILAGYLTPLENSWHVKSGEDSLISLKDPIGGSPFVEYFWPYCSVKLCRKLENPKIWFSFKSFQVFSWMSNNSLSKNSWYVLFSFES